MPVDELHDLSDWLNADNNRSQVKSEMEHIRAIQRFCRAEAAVNGQVRVASVIAKVLQSSAVTLLPQIIAALTRFVSEMGVEEMISELCDDHNISVNPNQLTVSHGFYEETTTKIMKKFVLIRLTTIQAQYTEEEAQPRMRPNPNLARFLNTTDLVNLGKHLELCALIEDDFTEVRKQVTPLEMKSLPPARSRQLEKHYRVQVSA